MFSKEVLQAMLGGLLRLMGAGVSMWLINKGVATSEQIELVILGLAGFLATVIWMWMNKAKQRVELLTGLTAQPGTTVNELKDQIKAGCKVPVETPNDAVPRAVLDAGSVKPPAASWLLPLLLAGSLVTVTACGGTFKPPVITPDDQAKVQDIAVKALAGIEIAGIVMRDGRQLVSDLEAAGTPGVTRAVRTAVNNVVIKANDIIQQVITKIDNAVKKVGQLATVTDVKGWAAEGVNAFLDVARELEKQADARVQMVGRFIRSALTVVGQLAGVEVTK